VANVMIWRSAIEGGGGRGHLSAPLFQKLGEETNLYGGGGKGVQQRWRPKGSK